MSTRLKIRMTGTAGRSCRLYWNSDLQEYVVRLYQDDKHYEPADYFTTDEQDALDTARTMCTYNPS